MSHSSQREDIDCVEIIYIRTNVYIFGSLLNLQLSKLLFFTKLLLSRLTAFTPTFFFYFYYWRFKAPLGLKIQVLGSILYQLR